VIGRGGETIRDLQERSGARIAVTPSPQDHDSTSRLVTITGDDAAIERAKSLIEEIVNDLAPRGGYGGAGGFQNSTPVTMTVPQESIGLVIGRGGETVKQLQIQSRAKIQVQQVEHGMPPPAERTINLFGPPEAVEYAKQLIMEKVAGAVSHLFTGLVKDMCSGIILFEKRVKSGITFILSGQQFVA
jgi:far upstream element-binding protein